MNGKLFLVSTPIGNLGDITLRAIEALKNADAILAEDTRVTGKLLSALNIKKPLISYHKFSEGKKGEEILERLQGGETLALCSDAGMPCISDPGEMLVKKAIENGIDVVPIPGANAALTALIASGISAEQFAFMGFFPRKKKEEEAQKIMDLPFTLIYYESPMRILETTQALADIMPNRQITIARELTKMYEEFIRGTAEEVLTALRQRESIKGEIVLIIAPPEAAQKDISDEEIAEGIKKLLNEGQTLKTAVRTVSEDYGLNKNRVYDIGKRL